MFRALAVVISLFVSGCAFVDYDGAAKGEFRGTLLVVWVGGRPDASLGDGKFIYVPLGDQALTFFRGSGANASPGSEVIRPEPFYTDGGSVPRSVQYIRGFNAWGYGPAYVIHDWLFVARKCMNDGGGTDEMKKLAKVTFGESARIMAETIKSLEDADDVSGPVISSVTAGPVSRRLWNETGQCEAQELTPEHKKLVRDIQRQERVRGADGLFNKLLRSTPQQPLRVGDEVVVAVARAQFN